MTDTHDEGDLLAEQVAYYRARADEYDDWWLRRGDYHGGAELRAAWGRDIGELRDRLAAMAPLGDTLELAAGTGNWTAELVRHASAVTAVDSSPEVLAHNAAKVPSDRVTRVEADVFDWQPPRRFDTVFASFWISHVPAERWDDFWSLVDASLAPGGRFVAFDNADHARAHGPGDWPLASGRRYDDENTAAGLSRRQLADGSEWTIVKRYWCPDDLVADLTGRGWEATAGNTTYAFLWVEARRRERR